MDRFLFPQWIDRVRPLAGALLAVIPLYLLGLVYYAGSPRTTHLGYSPQQPVAFSHAQHAGELGIDCRYCHNTVETTAHAAVPPTATCMNCHALIATDSDKLLLVHESAASGNPIPWVRVHDLPDYVYFNHGAHVSKGVGCISCHGRIDRMEQVSQGEWFDPVEQVDKVNTLSMGWCLDCHNNPGPNLRPREYVTSMEWIPGEDRLLLQNRLLKQYNIPEQASTDCSTCHR